MRLERRGSSDSAGSLRVGIVSPSAGDFCVEKGRGNGK